MFGAGHICFTGRGYIYTAHVCCADRGLVSTHVCTHNVVYIMQVVATNIFTAPGSHFISLAA